VTLWSPSNPPLSQIQQDTARNAASSDGLDCRTIAPLRVQSRSCITAHPVATRDPSMRRLYRRPMESDCQAPHHAHVPTQGVGASNPASNTSARRMRWSAARPPSVGMVPGGRLIRSAGYSNSPCVTNAGGKGSRLQQRSPTTSFPTVETLSCSGVIPTINRFAIRTTTARAARRG